MTAKDVGMKERGGRGIGVGMKNEESDWLTLEEESGEW